MVWLTLKDSVAQRLLSPSTKCPIIWTGSSWRTHRLSFQLHLHRDKTSQTKSLCSQCSLFHLHSRVHLKLLWRQNKWPLPNVGQARERLLPVTRLAVYKTFWTSRLEQRRHFWAISWHLNNSNNCKTVLISFLFIKKIWKGNVSNVTQASCIRRVFLVNFKQLSLRRSHCA